MIYCTKAVDKWEWHPWFAWYPVKIQTLQEGYTKVSAWAWWQQVWQKAESDGWADYMYVYALERPEEGE